MDCLKRLMRLTMVAVLPLSALVAGCGQAPELKKQETAETNTREEQPATSPAPVDESESRPAPVDGVKQGSEPKNGDKVDDIATGDGDDGRSRGITSPPKTAKPPAPSPTSPPPPPPAAEAPGAPAGGSAPAVGELGRGGAGAPAAVAPDKLFDVVPIFYGTDRSIEADPKRLQFGSDRAHKLQLGRALVTVPLAHKVPHIERPFAIEIPYFKVKIYEEKEDVTKHFTMQEIKGLTKEEMVALVKERLGKSSAYKDHAFVFVHGFNTAFDYALYRTAQIAYDLKFDGVPFVYSWPSGGKVASYTYDRASAEQSEPHLAEFLNLVVKESGAKSISLIAHSMGNELLLRVLERMRPQAPEGVVISQVILAAPDVDRDKFQNIARQISDFAKGVTLYAAANDRALGYSKKFWGGVPRAGDVPKDGPLVILGVDTIDVTAVSTDSLGLNHSGYAENNELLKDIGALILKGTRPPNVRVPRLETVKTTAGGAYWRYPAAH